MVDNRLEGRKRVGQPEGHDLVLEVPVSRAKGRLPFVSLLDANVGVRGRKVETRKVSYPYKLISNARNQGQRIAVLHRLAVQLSVVHAHPEFAILL